MVRRRPPRQLGRAIAQVPRGDCWAARTADKVNDLEAKGLTTARRDMVAEVNHLFEILWPERENEHNYDGPPGDEKIPILWDRSTEIFLCLMRRRSPAQKRRALGMILMHLREP